MSSNELTVPLNLAQDEIDSSQRLVQRARALARLQRLSRLLDYSFRVPGTRIRGGIDPIIGLIPGIGDAVGAALSAYVISEAARLGTSRRTLARMVGNAALEAVVGVIPLVGDAFDFAFKANRRNIRLLHRELSGQYTAPAGDA